MTNGQLTAESIAAADAAAAHERSLVTRLVDGVVDAVDEAAMAVVLWLETRVEVRRYRQLQRAVLATERQIKDSDVPRLRAEAIVTWGCLQDTLASLDERYYAGVRNPSSAEVRRQAAELAKAVAGALRARDGGIRPAASSVIEATAGSVLDKVADPKRPMDMFGLLTELESALHPTFGRAVAALDICAGRGRWFRG